MCVCVCVYMFTSTCVWRPHVYNRAGPQPTSCSLIGENCFGLNAKRKQTITPRRRWTRADRRGLGYVCLKPVTYTVSKQTWCRGTIPRGGWFVDWNVSGQSWHLGSAPIHYVLYFLFLCHTNIYRMLHQMQHWEQHLNMAYLTKIMNTEMQNSQFQVNYD